MVLHIDSDASYLSKIRARSRAGGNYYPSSLPAESTKAPNILPPEKEPIHKEFRILRHGMASAAKAEVGGGGS